MSDKQSDELDQQIEIFKVKKLIKNLEAARGNGTSMISLIMPPGTQISQISKMLSDEYGTASNIKSRVNRLSVLGAITSTQQRLKLYNKCPKVKHFIVVSNRPHGIDVGDANTTLCHNLTNCSNAPLIPYLLYSTSPFTRTNNRTGSSCTVVPL